MGIPSCRSVVVDDFDVERISVPPFKADSKLIVDPKTPLSLSITLELLQAIAGRLPKFFHPGHCVNLPELSQSHPLKCCVSMAVPVLEYLLGLRIPKRPNHDAFIVTR